MAHTAVALSRVATGANLAMVTIGHEAFMDVKRNFFHAPARREIFVALPPEDAEPGMCGRNKAMCGTRDAAMN